MPSTRLPQSRNGCRPGKFLLALVLTLSGAAKAYAVSCSVIAPHPETEAEQAAFAGKYDRAETLYRAQLQQKPNDPALTAALVEVLLRDQKMKEASDLAKTALSQNPGSAALLTAEGEVQYREGTIWLAAPTAGQALKADPCYPRLHLLNARLMRVNSMYASAAREIVTAHTLNPSDPEIQSAWAETLPLHRRIAELESYLAGAAGEDDEERKSLRRYLASLKAEQTQPQRACRLVSTATSTAIDFAQMMYDAKHLRAYGLDVKLNDRNARLEIDTGATGLLISRAIADRAGLTKFESGQVGGVGSQGAKSAYTAYVDHIRIGNLEFADCQVEVFEKRGAMDTDGLIGMDVFSNFLITLDYPMRRLLLDPLPPRPGEAAGVNATLETSASQTEEDVAGKAADASTPANADAGKAPAPTSAPSGPHDRYVAPEMKDWTPVYRIGHNLMLPAVLNEKATKLFILDTGAFSTVISPAAAREVTKVHSGSDVTVSGVSGEVDKVFTADKIVFRFARVKQENLDVVAFDTPGISYSAGTEVAGLIGITTLGQMTVKIDYRDGLVNFSYDANRGYKYPTEHILP